MFDHVTIRVSDRGASERFYELVLRTLGFDRTHAGETFAEWDDFSLAQADAQRPVTRRLHIGFAAPSRAHVAEFWRAGAEAGYRSEGEPGPRPQYGPHYYGGFLLDPDGNSAEAVHDDGMRTDGVVDHVWIRVRDVEASRRFFETIAPHAGLRTAAVLPDRVRFASARGLTGSFSVVSGEAGTKNVHLAFPAASDGEVESFHRAALEAGYRDNGGPGERREYHPGYYAAFVLDPDGNNVEVVDHHRA